MSHRYGVVAAAYDVTSLERPVYRAGRVAAVRDLELRPGDRVLDLGCGTGLSFPLLRQAVGPHGAVVGVDSSDVLLRQARRRLRRHAWANVRVVRGDAGQLPAEVMDAGPFDAVLAAYVLSIVDDGPRAWEQTLAAVRPGGRVAVVDLALPEGAVRVDGTRGVAGLPGRRLGRAPAAVAAARGDGVQGRAPRAARRPRARRHRRAAPLNRRPERRRSETSPSSSPCTAASVRAATSRT